MARGGFRPGAGRPRKAKPGEAAPAPVENAKAAAKAANMTPLEYMMKVMNDAETDKDRRDKMAIAAAPYVHAKQADAAGGKKDQRQKGAESVAGKFSARQPPRLVADNTK